VLTWWLTYLHKISLAIFIQKLFQKYSKILSFHSHCRQLNKAFDSLYNRSYRQPCCRAIDRALQTAQFSVFWRCYRQVSWPVKNLYNNVLVSCYRQLSWPGKNLYSNVSVGCRHTYWTMIGSQKCIFIIIFPYLFFYKALLRNVLLFSVVQALSN